MSDDTQRRLVAPSVPGKKVQGPADLVVRMGESTSETFDMVPLPARQQLGWHEEYERSPEHPELHEMHGVSPEEMLHSPLLSGGDQDTALNLTESVTYHLEATPPPAEPSGAPGTSGYNNINRGVPAAEGFEHPADFTLEQGASVRTFRLPEGVALDEDEQAKVDGTGPYAPGQVRVGDGDPRNQSDNTRLQTNQTPSVNDPYRNPDGSLKAPQEVQSAAPAYPDSEFGSKDLITDETVEQTAAVDTEGAKATPEGTEEQSAASGAGAAGDVPDGTVGDVMDWVGDDPAKARAALEVEQAKEKPRSSLVNQLNDKI